MSSTGQRQFLTKFYTNASFFPRATVYVPDFFILFFYMTLFSSSLGLDILILFHLIFNANMTVVVMFSLSLFLHSIFELILERNNRNENDLSFFPALNQLVVILFYLAGFGSLFVTLKTLKGTCEYDKYKSKPLPDNFPYPFFHIPDENLTLIKIYCIINVVLKCIPQFFILSILILERYVTGVYGFVLAGNILLNMVIFCQTMATTLPFRRFPRIFTSSPCIMLNGLNKFMATMCACCVNLVIFVMVYKTLKYYAVLVVLLKSLLWVWPTSQALRTQSIPYCKFLSTISFVFINILYGFIYIHPLERLGTLYYYFFYCLGLLYEILTIYIFTDAELDFLSCYLLLKILMFGFLSSFGLINIFQKFRGDESVLYLTLKRASVEPTDESKTEGNKQPQVKVEEMVSVEPKDVKETPKTKETSKTKVTPKTKEIPKTSETDWNNSKPSTSSHKNNSGVPRERRTI